MNSKYNPGDIVQIISEYAPGRISEDYLCGLPQCMLEEVKGKVVRILDVIPKQRTPSKRLSTDLYAYTAIDVHSNEVLNWSFSTEMFEESCCLEII